MVAIFDQRRSSAATWARRVAIFSAVLLMLSALSHRFGLLGTEGFLSVLPVAGALAVLALLLSAAGFLTVWRHGQLGGQDIAAGALVGLLVLSPFTYAGWKAVTLPMLNDISTDTVDPPPLAVPPESQPAALSSFDETAVERQEESYPEVVGRRYPAAADRVEATVSALMTTRGWTMLEPLRSAEGTTLIEAEGVTPILGLPFQVAVRIADEDDTTAVDMRSASQYGRHDLGDNAARISAFLGDLDAEMAKQAGT